MITIVGNDPRHFREVSCRNCSVILRYTLSDVKSRLVSDYRGDKDTVYYIICPNCSYEISVKGY